MKKDEHKTIVVFRTYRDGGDVLALFPAEVYNGHLCESYQRIGQHGGADYSHCIKITKPASPSEYASLKRELEGIGYNLNIKKRYSPSRG